MSRERGQAAEARAAKHLEALGYTIVVRNFRTRSGEIDLIAEDRSVLCFVEVRARATARFGTPEDTISRTKRRRIARAAEVYLSQTGASARVCRFDVVVVEGDSIRVHRDAFRLDDC